jgi:DNA-binding FrmR family transcriptional regulator
MHNEQARADAITRLRRIEGQIRGLQRMVEEGQNCEAILTQLMAARAALDKAGLFIVERYLDDCLRGTADPQVRDRLNRIIALFLRFGASGVPGERSTGDGSGTDGSD